MSLFALRNIACIRGGRLLFEGLSLELGAGETALVTGPNGSGKSSLLHVAAGLLRAAAGEVVRSGTIALSTDQLALDEKLPLRDALAFWARLDGRTADEGVDQMGLSEITAVPVRMLSSGQRKRASIARVISSGAKIWLLDEPLNALDAEGQERLNAAMDRHLRSGGVIVTASHQPLDIATRKVVPLG